MPSTKKTSLARGSGSPVVAVSSSIPPELLLEALGEESPLQRLRRDLAQAFSAEEPSGTPDSEPEQASREELERFFSDVGDSLSRMLQVYPKLLPPTAFTSRIVSYEFLEDHWSFDGAFCGDPRFFQGGLEGLNRVMDGIRDRNAPRAASL